MVWHRAAAFEDLKDGGVIGVDVAGQPVALYLLDGAVYATHNICTHQFAFLSDGYVEDGCIECPLHQALFDIRSGAAKSGPVSGVLRTYPARLENGAVLVDLADAIAAEAAAPAACDAACAVEEAAFVIVGAGQAGIRCAQALRKQGYRGALVLLGDEPHPPYERPPLSKAILTGQQSLADCHVLSEAEFAALDLDFRFGQAVAAIDRAAGQVVMADGERIPYAKLLLATGAGARRLPTLPADPRIHVLRTAEDAAAIAAALPAARHVVLLGGGFIGLEVASVAAGMGKQVTIVEREGHLLSRLLPPAAARLLENLAGSHGVRVICGAQAGAIAAAADGVVLPLAGGEVLSADLLVVSIGSVANTGLAEAAGLDVAGGIVVDGACRTSDADIYAAGDCALYHAGALQPAIRFESWQNAEEQAAVAAADMLGRPAPAPRLPWFWSDQFGLSLQLFGLPRPQHRAAIAAAAKIADTIILLYDGARLAAALCFGAGEAQRRVKSLLERNESLPPEELGAQWADQQDRDRPESDAMNKPLTLPAGLADAARSYAWPGDDMTRIPDWVYTDAAIYQREVERIFHGRTWNYVALEAEIPQPGDFVRSNVGPTPVVAARAEDGSINVFENRCAHRAAEFCRELRGNAKEFVCPYHQWSYDLRGNLAGVPFRRGVNGKGGMPGDFKPAEHGLRKLKVTVRRGVVFASYDQDIETLEEYLGPDILREFDATFDGRKLKVLGYYRNTLPGNWKLYHENLKDPYHATLLHTFLVTFGLLVAGNKSLMLCDSTGRHGVMASAKQEGAKVSADARKEMRAYKEGMVLHEPRFMDFVEEFESPWSVTMSTIWPNLIVQREMNTLGLRQIVPHGPNEFTMIWTMFGFEGDSEEMTRHRLRQGNLMGPAGFLGLEDNEAMKFVQDGMKNVPNGEHLVALDPQTPAGTSDTLISEAAIRAMYTHWRGVIGV